MNRQRLFLFLLSIITFQLNAQKLEPSAFDRYITANGLSHNYVTGIAQDSMGYLWIATHLGLNRFNGVNFVQFHSTNDSLSLAAEEVSEVTWLDSYRLGAFTAAGLHIVNTRTGETRNLFVPYHRQNYLYKFNTIVAAKADEKGNLYVLTRSGFYHFKDYKLVWRYDHYTEAGLANTHTHFGTGLLQLDSRRLVIVSGSYLYVYDTDNKQFKKMQRADCRLLADYLTDSYLYRFLQHKPGHFFILKQDSDTLAYVNTITNKKVFSRLPFNPGIFEFHFRTRLIAASDSVLYITGHNAGFYKMRFHPESGRVDFYPQKYFSSFLCRGLLKDRDNQLWVATTKGLFREDAQRSGVEFTALPPAIIDSFPNVRLSNVYVSAEKIYAGNFGEAGLLVFDKKTLAFEKQIILDKKFNGGNQVNVLVPAGRSLLLLGTNYYPLLFDEHSNKTIPVVPPEWDVEADWTNDLFTDSKGDIWLSAGNQIYRYNAQSKKMTLQPVQQHPMPMPVRITEDREGYIWMGSHGIARYNSFTGGFDRMVDSFPFLKMPDRQVTTFTFDRQNSLWTSSSNNGLLAYDMKAKTYRQFTTYNGLPDNNVVSLKQVDNKLWIACVSGIACMDLTTFQIVAFGKEDGFPDMPVVGGARFFYDSSSQQLYLCFINAVVRFNPYRLLQKKTPPGVFIEEITINGQPSFYLPGNTITTSWKANDLTVTIGSIGFADGGNRHFAYRILNAANPPWIEMGTQPSFSISELSAGTHRIQVKTYAQNDRWPPQVKEFIITVLPPLWEEPWFLVCTIIAILALLYLFVKWRISLAKRKEMVKTQIQKLKADDYKNQFELEQISHYFSSSLADKKTEDEVLWDVAENLIGRMNYEECIIYGWNDDRTKMIQKAAYGPKGKPELIIASGFEVAPGQGIVGHVIQTCQPVLVKDTREDHRYRIDDDFRLSEISVPIIHNDELLGVIDSEHHQPGYFTERDIKILTTIATLIGNKIKQLESEQTLEAKQQELAGINEQLAEARLSALQAQMNPHFVFNALNSIKRMILDSDNENASRYLSKFALMIRMTLNHSKEIFVTLHENIQYIKAYLEMEQLRFGEQFTYSIYTSENIDVTETTIPSMMIQPLVENAIWHGLMQAEGEKKIRIRFVEEEGKITCTVEDNGIGIRQSEKMKQAANPSHRSVGLDNLRKRIKIMNDKYDMDFHLSIMDLAETGKAKSGTRVVLQFNLINV